ncbi:MAG: hypothetical protein HY788_21640 [Deltaproteobacteria bacterium]|nr:hypothetical protein [Deltaproteobacteria bacterium]
MVDSKEWALEELEQANTIYEPYEVTNGLQLLYVICWFIEIAVISYAAFRFFSS